MDTDRLRNLVDYVPETGELIRKIEFAGNAKAGTRITGTNASGYIQCVIRGEFFYGHRLAWQLHYGEAPSGEIDHINGDPSDNRIANLRLASSSQNQQNTRLRKDNKSGFKGVSWSSERKKWVARLNIGGKHVLYKHFDDMDAAVAAVRSARDQFHGDFANHGTP